MTAPSLFTAQLSAVAEAEHRSVNASRTPWRARRRRLRTVATDGLRSVVLRPAEPGDGAALHRLEQLDGHRLPAGARLVAEADGRLIAAADVGTGTAVADPFTPSASVVDLLRLRAEQLRVKAA